MMEFENPTMLASSSMVRSIFTNERGLRSGWRCLIFILLLAAVSFPVRVALSALNHGLQENHGTSGANSPMAVSLNEATLFLAVLLATWIMSRIERQRLAIYGLPLVTSAGARFAIGYIALGFLSLTLVLSILRGLGAFFFGSINIQTGEAFYWAVAWGIVFLLVALFEEYLFRGYALHTLAEGIGFWPAALILGVLFACVHMGNGGENRIGIAGAFFFAMFAAATVRRTGNLWLAVGAHAGWNWAQSFFYGVGDSGFQAPGHLFTPRVAGPEWLSGGSVGPEGSLVTLAFWGLLAGAFSSFHRPRRTASDCENLP